MSKAEKYAWIMPALVVRDIVDSITIYNTIFGFELESSATNDQGEVIHAQLRYKNKTRILLDMEGGWDGNSLKAPVSYPEPRISPMIYVYVDDVDEVFTRAVKAGSKPIRMPENKFWGDREAIVRCVNGYTWGIVSKIEESLNP